MFFTWHVQALEAAEDSLRESHRAAPSALGAAGQETCGQQREGAPQETGLQARAGQEGWMHLEEWRERGRAHGGRAAQGRQQGAWQALGGQQAEQLGCLAVA